MMAMSSSAATLYISGKGFKLPTLSYGSMSSNYVVFISKPLRFYIRSSNENTSVETSAEEADSESSIEVPKGPPSLISALNVERALRGIRN